MSNGGCDHRISSVAGKGIRIWQEEIMASKFLVLKWTAVTIYGRKQKHTSALERQYWETADQLPSKWMMNSGCHTKLPNDCFKQIKNNTEKVRMTIHLPRFRCSLRHIHNKCCQRMKILGTHLPLLIRAAEELQSNFSRIRKTSRKVNQYKDYFKNSTSFCSIFYQ